MGQLRPAVSLSVEEVTALAFVYFEKMSNARTEAEMLAHRMEFLRLSGVEHLVPLLAMIHGAEVEWRGRHPSPPALPAPVPRLAGPMTGRQVEAFRDALFAAYDRTSFTQFLLFDLERRLDGVAEGGPFADELFAVIERACREGWHLDLIRASLRRNPDNPALLRFREEHPELARRAAAAGGGESAG